MNDLKFAISTPNAITINSVNVRKNAGVVFSIIKTLNTGTQVTIVGKELGWYKIQYMDIYGYVTDTLIKVTDSAIAEQYNPIKSNYHELALYTTRFSSSDANRNHNMELGGYKNNIILKPKESFSFNKNTGNSTTTANGWMVSIVLVNGKRVAGVGGGLCQTSSTIYSAVKQVSKLTILERHPHSSPVGYVPVSNEAMINYGTSDFRFRNDNNFDIFVYTTINHISGSLTSKVYKINPKPPEIPKPQEKPKPKVYINEKLISYNVPPLIINDSLYVEARSLFESLGYKLTYDDATKATKFIGTNATFILDKGSNSTNVISIKNGKQTIIPILIPIKIVSERTMFPIRFAAELLGYNVSWDEKTYSAYLSLPAAKAYMDIIESSEPIETHDETDDNFKALEIPYESATSSAGASYDLENSNINGMQK